MAITVFSASGDRKAISLSARNLPFNSLHFFQRPCNNDIAKVTFSVFGRLAQKLMVDF
jgi:hypothetical protein